MIVYLGYRVWPHIIIGFSNSKPVEVGYHMSRLDLRIYGIIGRHLFLDREESLSWRVSMDVRGVEGLKVGERLWVVIKRHKAGIVRDLLLVKDDILWPLGTLMKKTTYLFS